MSTRALRRMGTRWLATFAVLSVLTACSILDGPTEVPTSASIVVGGAGPGPLTLVTSNQFVFIFDNFGNRREEIFSADTSVVNPGYEADLELGSGARIFVSVGRAEESEETPQVTMQLSVRGEAICAVEAVLTDVNPQVTCTYTFN